MRARIQFAMLRCPVALIAAPPLAPPRAVLATLIVLVAAHASQAQQRSLEPVVVTGNRVETQVLEAPYAIGVVDADELRAGG